MSQICSPRTPSFQFGGVHIKENLLHKTASVSLKSSAPRDSCGRSRCVPVQDSLFNSSSDPLKPTDSTGTVLDPLALSNPITIEKHDPFSPPPKEDNMSGVPLKSCTDVIIHGYATADLQHSVSSGSVIYDPYTCPSLQNSAHLATTSYENTLNYHTYQRQPEQLPHLTCIPQHHSPTCIPSLHPSPSSNREYQPRHSPQSSLYSSTSPFQSPSSNSAAISPPTFTHTFPYISGEVVGLDPRRDVPTMDEWFDKWPGK